MAITSINGIINGLQQPVMVMKAAPVLSARWCSMYYTTGTPSAGSVPAAGLAGIALTSFTGQIPFSNPVSGNTYLAKWDCAAASNTQLGTYYLCDRLWHNNGIVVTSTAVQTIDSVQFPARDATGGTSGNSIMIGVEISTAMGLGITTFTMNYTNQDGVTATTTTAAQASGLAANNFIPIPLASGDTGVQKVNWWQQSATMTSGAYSLVAYRVIANQEMKTNIPVQLDYLMTGFPKLYDNSSLFFLVYMGNAAGGSGVFHSRLYFTQG